MKNTEDILVKKYSATDKASWDAFIDSSKNGTFLFKRDFMDYHSDRFEDFSLMIYRNSKLFAVLPAHITGNTVHSHRGLTYGSFVLQDGAKFLNSFYAFKETLQFLFQEGIENLDFRLIPKFYHVMPSDELEYFLYKANATLTKKDVLMVIDYGHQLKFQYNRRQGIHRAQRNGLELKIDQNYDEFWNDILIPNLGKKHNVKPVHSLEEMKLLASRFPENIKQVGVYKEGKMVAGTTVFLTKTTVHPQYISGNIDKNSYGSLDLLYDFVIEHFKGDRRYFDFNISSEDGGRLLNEGLIFWKETCGARSFTADNYSVKTASYKKLNLEFV